MRIADIGLGAIVVVALLATAASAQNTAASPMAMMHVDCAKATDMMTPGDSMAAMPKMSGDVDKDFTAMATMHEKALMMLMQVETQCGKDSKLKAAASKGMQENLSLLEMLQAQGQRY